MEYLTINGENVSETANIINRNSLYKNKGWFIRYAEKGWFGGSLIVAQILEDMREVLDAMYGENWQFFFISKLTLPKINILYPKIEISNSRGKSHTIRDLMISLDIVPDRDKVLFESRVRGLRLTVNKAEYISGYAHSHLYSKSYPSFNLRWNSDTYFCLGHNEIPELMSVFNDNQEIGTFELLLLTLNTMMSWESLEGTPYFHIGDISTRVRGYEEYYWNGDHAIRIADYLKDKTILQQLEYDMDLNKIKIIEDDFLRELVLKTVSTVFPEYLCIRSDSNVNRYYRPTIMENSIVPRNTSFNFKGKNIPFKIYNNRRIIEENENSSTSQVHPIVYNMTIENLNNYIYEKCITYSARK